jgi:hypothetical protein
MPGIPGFDQGTVLDGSSRVMKQRYQPIIRDKLANGMTDALLPPSGRALASPVRCKPAGSPNKQQLT